MAVSKKNREDYEEGTDDRNKGTIDRLIIDISGSHPDSEAYYKGRRGETFDEDKKR